ncbi:MAG: replication protein RepA [Candidatus Aenigmatarchaeota archaeon]|nr:MAG: replication protein RepA [Candidatus Aenigmarchaeota archaeon]
MSTPQRMPARERSVSSIKPEDTRVSLVGTVVGATGDTVAIDDGTGNVNVTFEEPPTLKTGQLVRVFGKTIPIEGGVEIQGEACQDFSVADVELYKKVSGLWESSLKQL